MLYEFFSCSFKVKLKKNNTEELTVDLAIVHHTLHANKLGKFTKLQSMLYLFSENIFTRDSKKCFSL